MQFELRASRCFPLTSACTSVDVSTSRNKYLIEIFNLCTVRYSAVIEELKSLHLRLNGEITGELQVTWKYATIYLLLCSEWNLHTWTYLNEVNVRIPTCDYHGYYINFTKFDLWLANIASSLSLWLPSLKHLFHSWSVYAAKRFIIT